MGYYFNEGDKAIADKFLEKASEFALEVEASDNTENYSVVKSRLLNLMDANLYQAIKMGVKAEKAADLIVQNVFYDEGFSSEKSISEMFFDAAHDIVAEKGYNMSLPYGQYRRSALVDRFERHLFDEVKVKINPRRSANAIVQVIGEDWKMGY